MNRLNPVKTASFYELFCMQYQCPPADFNQTVLRRCFYRGRYFFARQLVRVRHDYFSVDLALIEAVKTLTSATAVEAEISDFQEFHPHAGLFRGFLKMRLSARRLCHEAERLFADISSNRPL